MKLYCFQSRFSKEKQSLNNRYENQDVEIEFPWRVPREIIAYHYCLLLKEGVKKRLTYSNLCQNA